MKTKSWKEIKYTKNQLPRYGATLYDPLNGRFYLIGGEVGYGKDISKVNAMMSFSRDQGWLEHQLIIPRSSAMATLMHN